VVNGRVVHNCGTHCDSTAEVGLIKFIKSARISDGIVRLYYVAGENALGLLNEENVILNGLTSSWGVGSDEILSTATRFFDGYKKFSNQVTKQNEKILDLQMKLLLFDPVNKLSVFEASEVNPTMFIGSGPEFAQRLKDQQKGAVFVGPSWIYGLLGSPSLVPALPELETFLAQLAVESAEEEKARAAKKLAREAHEQKTKEADENKPADAAPVASSSSAAASKSKQLVRVKDSVSITTKDAKGKKVTEKVSGISEVVAFSYQGTPEKVIKWFQQRGFNLQQ